MTLSRQKVLQKLGQLHVAALERAAPNVFYGRLKKSFRYRVRDDGARATIFSAYYWATFVDQGRKEIKGPIMKFFDDPRRDPRVRKGYPKTVDDRVALSEVIDKDTENRLRREGRLIVTNKVAASKAYHFVDKAQAEVAATAPKYMQKFLDEEVDSVLRSTVKGKTVQRLSIRLS